MTERIGNTNWRPMSTVPMDGTNVLLGLANGWQILASYMETPHNGTYDWWRTDGHVNVPVEHTHRPGTINEYMKAVCWQPIEEVPEELLHWNQKN